VDLGLYRLGVGRETYVHSELTSLLPLSVSVGLPLGSRVKSVPSTPKLIARYSLLPNGAAKKLRMRSSSLMRSGSAFLIATMPK
jgi:hypothetical protein